MLRIAEKAFCPGNLFPLIHIDTGHNLRHDAAAMHRVLD